MIWGYTRFGKHLNVYSHLYKGWISMNTITYNYMGYICHLPTGMCVQVQSGPKFYMCSIQLQLQHKL